MNRQSGQRSLPRRNHRTAVALVLATLPVLSLGAPENITDTELAQVPPYCQDVNTIRYGDASSNTSPRAAYWVALMGKPFWALHHYCWGLIHVLRSKKPGVTPGERSWMLTSAINDYIYVLHNAPRDFVLAPEIYLRIGEAKLALGQVADAMGAFGTARELKPDYWPAYTRWVDVLLKTNQKAEAKVVAAEGLRFSPTSRDLIDRYRKLGGDPSLIVPAAVAAPASAPAKDAASADSAAAEASAPVAPAASR